MLAGESFDALVAAADRLGDLAACADGFGSTQRRGDIAEVFRERVEASIVLEEHVPLPGTREGGVVSARRDLATDAIIVREDDHKRGRAAGDCADLVAEGVREAMAAGARTTDVQVVLDEVEATRRCLELSRRGDLVVLCVDKHAKVMAELEKVTHVAVARGWNNDEQEQGVRDADFSSEVPDGSGAPQPADVPGLQARA